MKRRGQKQALAQVVKQLQSQQPQGTPQEPQTMPIDMNPRQGVGTPPDQYDPSVTHVPPPFNPGTGVY